jgi:hypothetical protein
MLASKAWLPSATLPFAYRATKPWLLVTVMKRAMPVGGTLSPSATKPCRLRRRGEAK